jgi:hypothetical protein
LRKSSRGSKKPGSSSMARPSIALGRYREGSESATDLRAGPLPMLGTEKGAKRSPSAFFGPALT